MKQINIEKPKYAQLDYIKSFLSLLTSCISFGKTVTRLQWIEHKFVHSKIYIKYASAASCRASNAKLWILQNEKLRSYQDQDRLLIY